MATLCKNCGRPVRFDPNTQRVSCDFCGSKFRPEELEEYAKDILEATEPSKVESDDYMESYVYACSSCGGEVVVNGTEVSTTCIYCGSPSVVFSRIARRKKPDAIIPFKVSKEDALNLVREKFGKGLFIPREVKNFKVDDVRGIYIPYWLVNAEHRGSVMLSGAVQKFDGTETTYFAKAGKMSINNLPVEASSMLSNEASKKLEPYNLTTLESFDESYLLGFYSDVADITFGEIKTATDAYGKKMFEDYTKESIRCDGSRNIISSYHDTKIDYKSLRHVMFPAWFITYFYEGRFNTILVNGQTGKVVCGVPWNKRLLNTILITAGTITTPLFFILYKLIFGTMFKDGNMKVLSDDFQTLLFIFITVLLIVAFGVDRIQKTSKSVSVTQEASTFRFVKRRQG